VDSAEATRLTNRIYIRLNARRPEIEKREEYFRGEQPLSFASPEWRKANSSQYAGFSDNWTGAVVNAEAERIVYTGMTFAPDDAAAGKVLREQWLVNEMEMQSSQGFVTTLATSRSFVIVWGDPSTDEPVVSWEHPSNVEIEYDWVNPRIRKAALKTWVDEKIEYATLYTATELWKFERPRAQTKMEQESQTEQQKIIYATTGGWLPREVPGETWPIENPLGAVPVVEIPNRPMLAGDPVSEIQGVIPMQDAINLLWAYLFLSADYASMDARVVLGSGPPMIPIIDQDPASPKFGQKVGEKPAEIKELRDKRMLYIDDKDASIDSWKAASLDVFTGVIDMAVGHIAAQTRTPPTYLVTKSGMSNVNADGLKASEIGMNKKVGEFHTFAAPAIREVNRLIALALGDDSLARLVRLGKVNWQNPEIRSEAQLADMLVKKKSIGYPLEYLMELDGIEPAEIPRILEMSRKESEEALSFGVQAAVESENEDVAPI
jgi:hypothetical protein